MYKYITSSTSLTHDEAHYILRIVSYISLYVVRLTRQVSMYIEL